MELIKWSPIDRKRLKDIRFTDPGYVRGYDLDKTDLTLLVTKYNQSELSRHEENRLMDHVLTLMQIVTENPRINPRPGELDELTDQMFLDMWNALHYIKENANPYSYLYRAGYTCACRFFKKRITDRMKEEAIRQHTEEEFLLYKDSISDHKVRCCHNFET